MSHHPSRFVAATLLTLAASSAAFAAPDFKRDIEPIFAKHCYSCHGVEKQKSGLRLDLKTKAFEGGDSGAVILPRDSAKSPLLAAVSGADPDLIMPPESEDDALTPAQVALLKAWIDDGAPWPDETASSTAMKHSHWSFQRPVRPAVPVVRDTETARQGDTEQIASSPRLAISPSPRPAAPAPHPIDAFVRAKLAAQKIAPSPEADRTTLLRRLSFDLLGLPPSPADVQSFVADTRPDAYERLVDRLLASPHYGERWGRHWLDLARYADSDGYEKDSPRPYAYLYRDWVIDAINRDLPFDQFTIEQLAGDLLPNATHAQKVATGFHRQTLINKEGGVDQEEFRNKAVVDRVDTTGTVWLGLTVGCAECHTHKYDPISQREFYQFFAFLNNADDQELPAPTTAQLIAYEGAKAKWDEARVPLKAAFDAYVRDELPAKQLAWEEAGKFDLPTWQRLAPATARAAEGTTLAAQPDHSITATGMSPINETYTVEAPATPGIATGFRLEVLPLEDGKTGPGRSGNGNFVLTEFSVRVLPANGGAARDVTLKKAAADFSQREWEVAGAIDGKPATGWAISPQQRRRHVATFEAAEPLTLAAGDKLIFTLVQEFGNQHTLGRFRLSTTSSAAPLRPVLFDDLIAPAWHTPRAERTAAQAAALTAHFRDDVDPQARKLRKALDDHGLKEPKFPETKAAILAERASPRATHVHVRGDFLRKGPAVTPATLAVLHPLKARDEKPDRLDLARWLMAEENPLTARVTVNHVWKNLFGRGLVTSVNDFGTRGEKPSHPELLDWLATEFSSRGSPSTGSTSSPQAGSGQPSPATGLGWSRKALIKLIVTSATYRQSSDYRTDLLDVDPLNNLLARQNRLRLEAEIIRDAHLAASGLLAPKIGGPSVKPPLPADIAALGYANSVKWQESEGEDRYRRGMYIFFQRTVPYPMLMTFDAPNATSTCTRRERSNTPLQALTLWNDPVFFDCARALGQRLMPERSVDTRLARAFEICLARKPSDAEHARLRKFYDDQFRLAQAEPASARAILGLGTDAALPEAPEEQASVIAAVRTIMNLDEFITRD